MGDLQVWTFVTSLFVQRDILPPLALSTFLLLLIAAEVEPRLARLKLARFVMVCGVAAQVALFSMVYVGYAVTRSFDILCVGDECVCSRGWV
jgi:membrane associated rhomboid family serine protease